MFSEFGALRPDQPAEVFTLALAEVLRLIAASLRPLSVSIPGLQPIFYEGCRREEGAASKMPVPKTFGL